MDAGPGIFRIQFHCSGKCREGFFKEVEIHQSRAPRQPGERIRAIQRYRSFAGMHGFVGTAQIEQNGCFIAPGAAHSRVDLDGCIAGMKRIIVAADAVEKPAPQLPGGGILTVCFNHFVIDSHRLIISTEMHEAGSLPNQVLFKPAY